MAILHRATLAPTKLELLAGWLPGRAWSATASGAPLTPAGAYRFDDPAGAVGVETHLVATVAGRVLQVPLTYRGEPLPDAQDHLVGTMEHSVLGRRWVYDGCGDPVWAAVTAAALLTGGSQVEELVDVGGGRLEPRASTAAVRGSGTPGTPVPTIEAVDAVRDEGQTTVVRVGGLEIVLARAVGTPLPDGLTHTLTGSWTGGGPAVLAGLRAATA